jgi:hypothetical protein
MAEWRAGSGHAAARLHKSMTRRFPQWLGVSAVAHAAQCARACGLACATPMACPGAVARQVSGHFAAILQPPRRTRGSSASSTAKSERSPIRGARGSHSRARSSGSVLTAPRRRVTREHAPALIQRTTTSRIGGAPSRRGACLHCCACRTVRPPRISEPRGPSTFLFSRRPVQRRPRP